jgi:hypothetical protein
LDCNWFCSMNLTKYFQPVKAIIIICEMILQITLHLEFHLLMDLYVNGFEELISLLYPILIDGTPTNDRSWKLYFQISRRYEIKELWLIILWFGFIKMTIRKDCTLCEHCILCDDTVVIDFLPSRMINLKYVLI